VKIPFENVDDEFLYLFVIYGISRKYITCYRQIVFSITCTFTECRFRYCFWIKSDTFQRTEVTTDKSYCSHEFSETQIRFVGGSSTSLNTRYDLTRATVGRIRRQTNEDKRRETNFERRNRTGVGVSVTNEKNGRRKIVILLCRTRRSKRAKSRRSSVRSRDYLLRASARAHLPHADSSAEPLPGCANGVCGITAEWPEEGIRARV